MGSFDRVTGESTSRFQVQRVTTNYLSGRSEVLMYDARSTTDILYPVILKWKCTSGKQNFWSEPYSFLFYNIHDFKRKTSFINDGFVLDQLFEERQPKVSHMCDRCKPFV